MKFDRIAKIISERDNISRDEAIALIMECCEEISSIIEENSDSLCAYEEAAYTVQDILGLEPDYIDELLDYIY